MGLRGACISFRWGVADVKLPLPPPSPARRAYLEEVNRLAREVREGKDDGRAHRRPRAQVLADAYGLFMEGRSIRQVANCLRVHEDTARRLRNSLVQAGANLPPVNDPLDEEQRLAQVLAKKQMSLAEAGKELGWTKSKASRVARRARERAERTSDDKSA